MTSQDFWLLPSRGCCDSLELQRWTWEAHSESFSDAASSQFPFPSAHRACHFARPHLPTVLRHFHGAVELLVVEWLEKVEVEMRQLWALPVLEVTLPIAAVTLLVAEGTLDVAMYSTDEEASVLGVQV